MELEKRPGQPPAGGGCLTTVVRIPVRIVVLVLVVPCRMVWDALVVCGRFAQRTVLRPTGRALQWCWWTLVVGPVVAGGRGLGRGLGWLGRVLVVAPAVWLYGQVLTPVGHGLVWLARGIGAGLAWLGRGIGTGARGIGTAGLWLGRYLFVVPAGWLYRGVLTPLGHGLAWLGRGTGAGLGWLGRVLVAVPAVWLYRRALTPLGHGIAWVARGIGAGVVWAARGIGAGVVWAARGIGAGVEWVASGIGTGIGLLVGVLVVVPAVFVWRRVLVPVGRGVAVVAREIGDALGHAWRIAGHVSRAVGRALGGLLRWLFVNPARWVYVSVLTPVGHAVRDTVWRPVAQAARDAGRVARQVGQDAGRAARQALTAARESARETRADIRRMLFGAAREAREPVRLAKPRREPGLAEARTLGSGTTALTKLTKD
ncbi:hypothetical protein [Streptomyces apocyni]|uniref:hypothetical protein n=1 Tax=Streptomyces apocyni TaxID=2654677 RepID=UPI0012EA6754|nr:hypothetical protein [Streptomyces apocyni]